MKVISKSKAGEAEVRRKHSGTGVVSDSVEVRVVLENLRSGLACLGSCNTKAGQPSEYY